MKKSPSSEKSTIKSHPSLSPQDYTEIKETVRYSETDRLGIAHNKNYFEWFELGRTEFVRSKGIPYAEIEALGFYLVVAEACCRYKRPLRYDESFFIRTGLSEMTSKKTVFAYELVTGDGQHLIASGYTVHISTDKDGKVTPLPPEIVEKIRG
jgi:acyl-CoA thioester hydrolase